MNEGWVYYDENSYEKLKDHYYYLVAHRDYETPMKAKWHSELGGHWEVFIGNGKPNEFIYAWDNFGVIKAWRELPLFTM